MPPRPCLCGVGMLLLCVPALAQTPLSPSTTGTPSLERPLRVQTGNAKLTRPLWSNEGLWPAVPTALRGLATVERCGFPVYDASSRAWYAAANGALVELRPDGRLPVVIGAALQGRDIDVRARAGVLVSREPDHTIVLLRWADGEVRQRSVLISGARFFRPRLSPDGSRVLVAESRATGGHLWLLSLDGKATDLGPGYDGAWHPDGVRILFTRVSHDGHRVTAADLWQLELASGRRLQLTRTTDLAEVEPALSPDGRYLAFVDATSGDLYLARFGR
jgi:hypothetical protein